MMKTWEVKLPNPVITNPEEWREITADYLEITELGTLVFRVRERAGLGQEKGEITHAFAASQWAECELKNE
jgi:hypothetical protein